MARRWTCGLGLQSVTNGHEFASFTGTFAISTAIKRSGTASFRSNPTAGAGSALVNIAALLPTASARVAYYRAYLRIDTAPGALVPIIRVQSGTICSIRLNSDRTLELWNDNAGTQIGSDSAALALNDFENRIEIAVTTNASDQITALSARINGSDFASTTGLSFAYTPGAIGFEVGAITNDTCDLYFDDLAVNDDQGSAQNSYPGAGKVVYLFPTAAGDTANGARGGTDTGADWSQLSEIPPDDATTYYRLDINNDAIDVQVTDPVAAGIGATDTVTLVHVRARKRGAATGLHGWNTRLKSASGGTISTGTALTLNSTTWFTDSAVGALDHTSYTDPTTAAAWTVTGTNSLTNMQIGVQATDAAPDVDVSALWAIVEYVPAAGSATITPTVGALLLASIGPLMNFGINIPTDTV